MFSFVYASGKTTTATYSHRGMELCRAILYVCVRSESNGGSVLYRERKHNFSNINIILI